MKKILIVLLFTTSFLACNNESEQSQNTKYAFLIQDTLRYTRTLDSVPSVQPLLEELKGQLHEYLTYAKYLSKDSAEGMQIDFVGMMHSTMFDDAPVEGLAECQSKIYEMFPKYDFLGFEGLMDFGIITKDDFIKQQVRQIGKYYKDFFEPNTITYQIVDRAMPYEAENSAIVKYLLMSPQSNALAADDILMGIIQERLIQGAETDLQNKKFFISMTSYYTALRSELAVAKVIAYLRQHNLQQKKVLIVYGALHMSQFKGIARKLGLVSSFFIPEPCKVR